MHDESALCKCARACVRVALPYLFRPILCLGVFLRMRCVCVRACRRDPRGRPLAPHCLHFFSNMTSNKDSSDS